MAYKVLTSAFYWFRCIYSTLLFLFATGVVIYAIVQGKTAFYPQVPFYVSLIILVVFFFFLGILEGMQICVIELMKQPPEIYKDRFPRAWGVVQLAMRPHNLERFLMGRQVVVLLLIFFLARLTTVDKTGVFPEGLEEAIFATGLLGALTTTIAAQLVPRVIAIHYPVHFINFFVVKYAFLLCTLIEFIGFVHACWLFTALIAFLAKLQPVNNKDEDNESHELEEIGLEVQEPHGGEEAFEPAAAAFEDAPREKLLQDTSSRQPVETTHGGYIPRQDLPAFLLPRGDDLYAPAHVVAWELLEDNGRSKDDPRSKTAPALSKPFKDLTPEDIPSGPEIHAWVDAVCGLLLPDEL